MMALRIPPRYAVVFMTAPTNAGLRPPKLIAALQLGGSVDIVSAAAMAIRNQAKKDLGTAAFDIHP